jgi:phosphopantetheinyl transferase
VGIDAEYLKREPRYTAILKRFALNEQAEIRSTQDFLIHWTAKESAVKYMGTTLALDLKHLTYTHEQLTYKGELFHAKLSFLTHEGYQLCVCSGDSVQDVEFIALSL